MQRFGELVLAQRAPLLDVEVRDALPKGTDLRVRADDSLTSCSINTKRPDEGPNHAELFFRVESDRRFGKSLKPLLQPRVMSLAIGRATQPTEHAMHCKPHVVTRLTGPSQMHYFEPQVADVLVQTPAGERNFVTFRSGDGQFGDPLPATLTDDAEDG